MRNQVIVHRVVKNTKRTGQYIEPHSHAFFHYIYALGGHTRVTVAEEVHETEPGSLVLIPPETDVFEAVRTANADGAPLACVLCDESQFFTAQQAEQLFMVTVDLNIPVICYGLRADFSLKGFPGSTRLLELAHTIEEMKTICT